MASEIEAAAERLTENGWNYASCPDHWGECNDARVLAQAYLARLAADRAEREERARPIDAEWCISQGAKRWDAGRECLFDCGVCFADHVGDAGILRGGVYFKATTFHGVPQNCHVPQIKTRGQLLDLLRVLKGGA